MWLCRLNLRVRGRLRLRLVYSEVCVHRMNGRCRIMIHMRATSVSLRRRSGRRNRRLDGASRLVRVSGIGVVLFR